MRRHRRTPPVPRRALVPTMRPTSPTHPADAVGGTAATEGGSDVNLLAWSILLSVVNVAGLHIAVRHQAGWVICLLGEALWLVYTIITGQWGFLIAVAAYVVEWVRHWRKAQEATC